MLVFAPLQSMADEGLRVHPVLGGMGKQKVRSTLRDDALSGSKSPLVSMNRSLPVIRYFDCRTP